MRQAAEGILWNLKSSHAKGTLEQRSMAMVSYSHSDAKSCRQELSYASDTLKKRIIPIYAPDQHYRASGWLGIRIAGQKYVHFGRKLFADALKELLSMMVTNDGPVVVSPPKTKGKEHPLKHWTANDIRQWFDENHMDPDLTKFFHEQFHTGTALVVYAHHLKQCYRSEYAQVVTNYRKTFAGKSLQTVHFITIVDALWRLREEYHPQSRAEDTWEYLSATLLNETLTWF